jgi:UDP-glucose 4-epimerase
MVAAFESATGRKVPYVIGPRREGDIAECWADPALANRLLGWTAEFEVARACADGWRWQQKNPEGYRT